MEKQETHSHDTQTLIERQLKDTELLKVEAALFISLCKKHVKDFRMLALENLKKKKILYIRHAESGYNAWKRKNLINLISSYQNITGNYDPSITEKGREQCKSLIPVLNTELKEKVELVLISPLRRAIQTFHEVKEATALKDCSKVMLTPLLRERMDTAGDIGSPTSDLKELYPHLDFEFMVSENWWNFDINYDPKNRLESKIRKEDHSHVKNRIALLLIMIAFRKESTILLVGHSNYYNTISQKMRFIEPNIKNAEMKVLESQSLMELAAKILGV